MNIEQALPGTRIIERHVTAHPRTVVERETDHLGLTGTIIVVNDNGRRSKIKAKSLPRYDIVKETAS